jgi:hypothetical protein
VPADIPVITPVLELIVATDVVLLAHVPPVVLSVNVVVPPTQMAEAPMIAIGAALTVTTFVA